MMRTVLSLDDLAPAGQVSAETRAYVAAVLAADPSLTAEYKTRACPECDDMPEPDSGYVITDDGQSAHIMIDSSVVVGCEGFYVVSPVAVGYADADTSGWLDWRDIAAQRPAVEAALHANLVALLDITGQLPTGFLAYAEQQCKPGEAALIMLCEHAGPSLCVCSPETAHHTAEHLSRDLDDTEGGRLLAVLVVTAEGQRTAYPVVGLS